MFMLRLRPLARLVAIALIVGGASAPQARADAAYLADDFVRTIGNRIIRLVANKEVSAPLREAHFRAIYRSDFHDRSIAAWVLGRAWEGADEQGRREFMSLLEAYIVKSFMRRLADYGGQQLLVMRSTIEGNVVVVSSQLVDPDPRARRNIEIVWRLARVGDRLRVYDVVVDKISVSLTLRREIGDMLREQGGTLKGLLLALRRQVGSAGEAALLN
jgi:phospholipid transport system substrate-binding protein